MQKQRVSRHNGRSGKNGVYNPKHNDRSFNVEHADNIDENRTALNLYWDCRNGLRTHEENAQFPTFTQLEHDEYERRYGGYIAGQCQRNIKAGHASRNRTIDDLLADKRVCPEETIYQIGKEGDCPSPDVLTAIVTEFFAEMEKRFGEHVHVLDWALHMDETSPHIHARQVFDVINRYGECEPKQEKALEQLGIPLPDSDKKPGRTNNRKMTFDAMCRDLLLTICQEHGLAVETEAIYGGKASLEKNDYIIDKQTRQIAELEQERQSAEAQAQSAEQEAEKVKQKLDTWTDEKRDILAQVKQFGTVEELLPPPSLFTKASTYRETVAIPKLKALFTWCKHLAARLQKSQNENKELQRQLRNEKNATEHLSEKAHRFDQLVDVLGLRQVENYLYEHAMQRNNKSRQSERTNQLDR